MSFVTHGEFSFHVEDHFLIIEGTGPWNLEAIISSTEQAKDCHKQLYGAKWGAIGIFFNDPILTPDAARFLTECVIKDRKNGRIASALILAKTDHPDFARHHIAAIYNNAGEVFEFFDDVDEAKIWLKEQIANS